MFALLFGVDFFALQSDARWGLLLLPLRCFGCSSWLLDFSAVGADSPAPLLPARWFMPSSFELLIRCSLLSKVTWLPRDDDSELVDSEPGGATCTVQARARKKTSSSLKMRGAQACMNDFMLIYCVVKQCSRSNNQGELANKYQGKNAIHFWLTFGVTVAECDGCCFLYIFDTALLISVSIIMCNVISSSNIRRSNLSITPLFELK